MENHIAGELVRLQHEYEKLRAIFETANEEFAKLRRKLTSLEEEVRHEKEKNTILEEENRSLKLELGKAKGVVKKLSSILFGLKSEKLKIADIDIKDTVAFEGKETAISPNEVTSKVSFLEEKEKRPKGAVSGHPGHGRKIPDEIWADILVSKYMRHIPVDRQLFEMVQAGITIKAGMIFNSLKRIYFRHLEMLYEVLLSDLRQAGQWHANETRWKMFLEKN